MIIKDLGYIIESEWNENKEGWVMSCERNFSVGRVTGHEPCSIVSYDGPGRAQVRGCRPHCSLRLIATRPGTKISHASLEFFPVPMLKLTVQFPKTTSESANQPRITFKSSGRTGLIPLSYCCITVRTAVRFPHFVDLIAFDTRSSATFTFLGSCGTGLVNASGYRGPETQSEQKPQVSLYALLTR